MNELPDIQSCLAGNASTSPCLMVIAMHPLDTSSFPGSAPGVTVTITNHMVVEDLRVFQGVEPSVTFRRMLSEVAEDAVRGIDFDRVRRVDLHVRGNRICRVAGSAEWLVLLDAFSALVAVPASKLINLEGKEGPFPLIHVHRIVLKS